MTNGLPAHGSVIERAIVLGDGIVHGLVTMNGNDGPQVIHATMVRIGGPGSNSERRWKVVQTPLLDFVHPCTFPLLEPDEEEEEEDDKNGLTCGNGLTGEHLAQQIADFWRPCECFAHGNDAHLVELAEGALGRTFSLKGKPDSEFMSLLGTPSLCRREKIVSIPLTESKWIEWPSSDRVVRAVRTIGIGLAGAGAGVAISAFGGPISLGMLGATAAAYWYTKSVTETSTVNIEML